MTLGKLISLCLILPYGQNGDNNRVAKGLERYLKKIEPVWLIFLAQAYLMKSET